MKEETCTPFDTDHFLSTDGPGRRVSRAAGKERFFRQGDVSDSVFYLLSGTAKLTVVSKKGKEATITILSAGDFFGEEAVATPNSLRSATASAVSVCVVIRIDLAHMHETLRREHAFTEFFMKFILFRGIRTQANLVDQLFNSSERRLARTLLLMANFGRPGEPTNEIPDITQEALADLVGTTRSRVSFFMNRFRKLGYIDYNGHITVHRSLLKVVLLDELPEQDASRPVLVDPLPSARLAAKRAKLT